ncbi:MAG: hypothetical protein QXS41_01980 [Candidatus Woesearchaeota archaeon]
MKNLKILLKYMFKEELSFYKSYLSVSLFYVIPFMILFIATIVFSLNSIFEAFSDNFVVILSHLIFLFFGINVGAFGMFVEEILHRRFGNASTITYSARTQPVSERKIFFAFVIKEMLFYLFLIIIPILIGIGLALYYLNQPNIIINLISLSLIFFFGQALVFMLSSFFTKSKIIFLISTIISGIVLGSYFEKILFVFNPSWNVLLLNLVLILIFDVVAIFSAKLEEFHPKKYYKNRYLKLLNHFPKQCSVILAKDVLDFSRTVAGFSKLFFSYIFPIIIIYFLSILFVSKFPMIDVVFVFIIFFGMFTSTLYQWFTQFESFSSYNILPISKENILNSKVFATHIFNIFSHVIILTLLILNFENFNKFLIYFVSYFAIYYYSLYVLVYLTGFYPHIRLFNVKILIQYMLFLLPALIVLLALGIINVNFLWFSLLLLPISIFLKKEAMKKINNEVVIFF